MVRVARQAVCVQAPDFVLSLFALKTERLPEEQQYVYRFIEQLAHRLSRYGGILTHKTVADTTSGLLIEMIQRPSANPTTDADSIIYIFSRLPDVIKHSSTALFSTLVMNRLRRDKKLLNLLYQKETQSIH